MRWSALAASILLLGVPASAQQDAVADDGSGDARGMGAADGAPSPLQGSLDLVRLGVEEDRRDFVFHLEVADLSGAEAGDHATSYHTEFRHADQRFAIASYRTALPGSSPAYGAQLQVFDAGLGRFVGVEGLDMAVAGNTMSTTVPRDLLRDGHGVPPTPGRALEDFFVGSASIRTASICITECLPRAWWGDRMPDQGVADRVHEIVHGVEQSGHARLASQQPFRASNGEATTFVFHVEARNHGQEAERFRFNVSGAPPQWDVRTPSTVAIDGGGSVQVPVVVRTAFAHAHGSATTFVLEMRSLSDPGSVGRLEMGVFYPVPPQPAGHHDTLWLHTRDRSDDLAYLLLATALEAGLGAQGLLQSEHMNTIEDDELADEVPSDGRYCDLLVGDPDYPAGSRYCWEFPLSPGLEMGLDFDVGRLGQLDVTIGSQLPLPAAAVGGELVYLAPVQDPQDPFGFFNREEIVLATLNRSAPQDIGALSEGTYSLAVTPTPESDLVPFQQGAAMELRLHVLTLRPDNFFLGPRAPPPTLHGGARMQLPLLEYEDPVQGAVDFGGGVLLDPLTAQERRVNPGKTVLFKATLQNVGGAEHTFRLDLAGSHREWSRLLAPDVVRLGPGDEKEVAVAVSAPADAAAGDRADLVLEAASQEDVSSRALLRLLAVVTTDEELPDESEAAGFLEQAPAKKSPVAVLWTAAILVVLWVRRHPNR